MRESMEKYRERKRVSILLSCWRADALVKEYIDALLSPEIQQSCTLIAVDFPFSHQNASYVRDELHRYPDIVHIERNDPLSLYAAWNIAAQAATTDYVGNLNLDDRVSEDYYIVGVHELDASGVDVFSTTSLMTNVIGQWGEGARRQGHLPEDYLAGKHKVSYGLEEFVYSDVGVPRKRNPPHCAPIWRRKIHETNGWFNCKKFDFCADFEFWIRLAAKGGRFILLNEPKTLFFAGPGTASDRILHKDNEKILDRWEYTFPPPSYRETHLGRRHDLLHHCMNINVLLSCRAYFWHLNNIVSIVVTATKGAEFLLECLKSIAAQDYTLIDCIVVLDEPDIDTEKVAKDFSHRDVRFRCVVLSSRMERNYARNVGLTLAIGRWVCIVDGDDTLPDKSISSRVIAACKYPGDIVFGGLEVFNGNGVLSKNDGKESFSLEQLRLGWPSHCTLLIPRDCDTLKILSYPADPSDPHMPASHIAGEDVKFIFKLLKGPQEKRLRNSGAVAYRYRRHASSSYKSRYISIAKVIGLLIFEFGFPVDGDADYAKSFAKRLINFACWCQVSGAMPEEHLKEFRIATEKIRWSITHDLFLNSIEEFYREFSSVRPSVACAVNLERLQFIFFKEFEKKIDIPLVGNNIEELGVMASEKFTGGMTTSTPNFSRLLRFQGRHAGRDCLLMCNGPSLKEVDFSRIDRSRFNIIGLNKIHLGFDSLGVRPDYIVAINKKVLNQTARVYIDLPIVKFISNRCDLSELPADPMLFHVNTAMPPPSSPRFSKDIVKYVNEGWTVTHAALQIAYYMGFGRVYIIGMDHRFSQHVPGQENKESVILGDDKDHFHPAYFGHGQAWDLPDLANSEISYIAARKAYEEVGRKIFDCTINGACEIFEKSSIEEIYSK